MLVCVLVGVIDVDIGRNAHRVSRLWTEILNMKHGFLKTIAFRIHHWHTRGVQYVHTDAASMIRAPSMQPPAEMIIWQFRLLGHVPIFF